MLMSVVDVLWSLAIFILCELKKHQSYLLSLRRGYLGASSLQLL